jgi:hypothetical protein
MTFASFQLSSRKTSIEPEDQHRDLDQQRRHGQEIVAREGRFRRPPEMGGEQQ